MGIVFALGVFVAAALLFMVQPFSGRVLLPLLGGSPAVWNTCVVCFQALLLLGYFYSHALSKVRRAGVALTIHIVLLGAGAAVLPLRIDVGEPSGDPVWWVVRTLGVTLGLPYLALATTGPLLQRWYAGPGRDPYPLYSASNLGSLVGLLGYPLVIEPWLTRHAQASAWSWGYGAFALLTLLCAKAAWPLTQGSESGTPAAAEPAPARKEWAFWVVLAMVPSSLMVGVTQHITTDVASIPLLWVIPLGVYLLTFVVAFAPRRRLGSMAWGRVLPSGVLVAAFVMLSLSREPAWVIASVHVAVFAIVALMCHTRLAERRPGPAHLTSFYLALAVGGVLGGLFNSLLAPRLFSWIAEYPIMLGVALLLRPQVGALAPDRRWGRWALAAGAGVLMLAVALGVDQALQHTKLPRAWMLPALRAGVPAALGGLLLVGGGHLRFAGAVLGLLLASDRVGRDGARVLARERTFFGVHVVTETTGANDTWRSLAHGTTLHGMQSVQRPQLPTTYYHPTGPAADVVARWHTSTTPRAAAFVGLGCGSMAAYARPGDTIDFFDIDPAVVRFANDPSLFTFIHDAKGTVRCAVGDGRLLVRGATDASYGLIVIDAFSSDAVPMHLITRDAVALDMQKLAPGGVLAFHVSSRSFALQPVLARIAGDLGLVAWTRKDLPLTTSQTRDGKLESDWVVLARSDADLGALATIPTPWTRLKPDPKVPLWTDEHANVLSAFRW